MKIMVLLRYPRAERSAWKRALLERLVADGCELTVLFGEASRWRHLRAAMKLYGAGWWRARHDLDGSPHQRLVEFCREHAVRVERVGDLNGGRSRRIILAQAPDLLVLLGTGIMRAPILGIPRLGTLHCHQGQLPAFRGVNTIEWSIFQQRDVHITTHYVDAGIDTGRILHTRQVPVSSGDAIADVRRRCQEAAVELLLQTIGDIRAGRLKPTAQEAGAGKQYFSMHPFFRGLVEQMLARGTGCERTVA